MPSGDRAKLPLEMTQQLRTASPAFYLWTYLTCTHARVWLQFLITNITWRITRIISQDEVCQYIRVARGNIGSSASWRVWSAWRRLERKTACAQHKPSWYCLTSGRFRLFPGYNSTLFLFTCAYALKLDRFSGSIHFQDIGFKLLFQSASVCGVSCEWCVPYGCYTPTAGKLLTAMAKRLASFRYIS